MVRKQHEPGPNKQPLQVQISLVPSAVPDPVMMDTDRTSRGVMGLPWEEIPRTRTHSLKHHEQVNLPIGYFAAAFVFN